MIKLHARLGKRCDAEPFVARVARTETGRSPGRDREILLVDRRQPLTPGYRAYLVAEGLDGGPDLADPEIWPIPESLLHLSDGDIVRISPRSGELWVMYRRASAFNSILMTESCNSSCVMCSQPPKAWNYAFLFSVPRESIPLMPPTACQ